MECLQLFTSFSANIGVSTSNKDHAECRSVNACVAHLQQGLCVCHSLRTGSDQK